MHRPYLFPADILGVLEREPQHALRGRAGDQFDALHDAVDDDVLDAGVFALGVFADEDRVNIVVGGFVAGDGLAGADVGEKVEGAAKGEVERDMAFTDWGLKDNQPGEFCKCGCWSYGQGSFQSNEVSLDALDGFVRYRRLSVFEDWRNVDRFPFNWGLNGFNWFLPQGVICTSDVDGLWLLKRCL